MHNCSVLPAVPLCGIWRDLFSTLETLSIEDRGEVCLNFEKQETEDCEREGGRENLELMAHSGQSVVGRRISRTLWEVLMGPHGESGKWIGKLLQIIFSHWRAANVPLGKGLRTLYGLYFKYVD